MCPLIAFKTFQFEAGIEPSAGGATPAGGHHQSLLARIPLAAIAADINVPGWFAKQRVRTGTHRCPYSGGLGPESCIVLEMQDMNHLVLERIVYVSRENLMVLAADFDQLLMRRVRTSRKHPGRVLNSHVRQFASEIRPIEAVEQTLKFRHGRQAVHVRLDGPKIDAGQRLMVLLYLGIKRSRGRRRL